MKVYERTNDDMETMNDVEKDIQTDWHAIISIGQNAKENDLLFHKAHQNDVWFHLKNLPSAHLYLHWKNDILPDKETQKEIYTECANLVKQFSKCSHNARINYIQRKYLKKETTCKPGEVILKKSAYII